MKIEGRITKSGEWWAAEVPLLLIFTQGRTKKEAYAMTKEAIEDLIDVKGFEVVVVPDESNTFRIGSNNDGLLMAFALRQQRAKRGLSVRDVAQKMGSASPNTYSRYESGQVRPSLEKFSQLLCAIGKELEPVLKIG
jgi:predicted RNase H-like HicB family nuclease/DNA-binding XRE family transcriptional regulator